MAERRDRVFAILDFLDEDRPAMLSHLGCHNSPREIVRAVAETIMDKHGNLAYLTREYSICAGDSEPVQLSWVCCGPALIALLDGLEQTCKKRHASSEKHPQQKFFPKRLS